MGTKRPNASSGVEMGNERLRDALRQAGVTTHQLAEAVEVDPKTVERWLANGRLPHPRHRAQASAALEVEETYLWPELLNGERVRAASEAELVTLYPTRGDVPGDLWRRLVDAATANIDILVYSGLFLIDTHPNLPAKLVSRAEEGLSARLLYGDPNSDVVVSRGDEEGIGEDLAARIRLSLTYLKPRARGAADRAQAAPIHPLQLDLPLRRRDAGEHARSRIAGWPESSPAYSAGCPPGASSITTSSRSSAPGSPPSSQSHRMRALVGLALT